MNEFCYTDLLEKGVIIVSVSYTMPPLLIGLEYVCLRIVHCDAFVEGIGSIEVFEYVFGIEEFRINGLRSKEFATNDEYLCRDISGELLVTRHKCWT